VARVAVVAHVLTYVVQQRRELEKLAIASVQLVQAESRVEQLESQSRDLAGMGLGPPRTVDSDRTEARRSPRVVAELDAVRAWRSWR